jgi:hypothetical protein
MKVEVLATFTTRCAAIAPENPGKKLAIAIENGRQPEADLAHWNTSAQLTSFPCD